MRIVYFVGKSGAKQRHMKVTCDVFLFRKALQRTLSTSCSRFRDAPTKPIWELSLTLVEIWKPTLPGPASALRGLTPLWRRSRKSGRRKGRQGHTKAAAFSQVTGTLDPDAPSHRFD